MLGRPVRVVALVMALALTAPIALLGALAGILGAACEGWLILVGRLAESVGWGRRRR